MSIESINDKDGTLIAQVYDITNIGSTSFPTPEESSLQFGVGITAEDKTLEAHIHKRVKRTVDNTSEFLCVVSGLMKVDIYSESEILVTTVELRKNMALLQFYGGHKIFLQAGTKYFELKQGPYYGRSWDKYVIEG
jgi:hypothetical protein